MQDVVENLGKDSGCLIAIRNPIVLENGWPKISLGSYSQTLVTERNQE